MRKELGKVLRSTFKSKMGVMLPQFREEKVKSEYFFPGDRAFRHQVGTELALWIVLCPSNKGLDEFTVMVGWSRLARYPELSMVPCILLPSQDRREFEAQEYMTRLPFIMGRGDEWWVIKSFGFSTLAELLASLEVIPEEKAKDMVMPKVEDAVASIVEFGEPYLAALVEWASSKRGV